MEKKNLEALCSKCGIQFQTEESFDLYLKCPNGHSAAYPEEIDYYKDVIGETIERVFTGEHQTLLLTKSGKILLVYPTDYDGANIVAFQKEE